MLSKHATINIVCFIVVLFLNLMIKTDHTKWTALSDPYDYLQQSKFGYGDTRLWMPEKTDGFCPRPFTVPLFYKFASSDPDRIIIMQKFLHSVSILILVFSMLLYVRKSWLRTLVVFFVYLLMSWWNILGWTTTLLSESISLSLMFLWIATLLIYLIKPKIWKLVIHILLTVLFCFTRDNWPFVLMACYFFLAVAAWWTNKKLIRPFVLILGLCLAIFFIQAHAASIGKRYRVPILNNIVYKILPNNKYMDWFAKEGMPCTEKLQYEYGKDSVSKDQLFGLYNNTSYIELFEWIDANGKNVWAKFLITHPKHTLLFEESGADLSRILAYNVGYTGGMRGYTWISYYIFPLFNPVLLLLLLVVQWMIFLRKKEMVMLVPTVLTLIFWFNAFLMYHADAMEVPRHMFVTNIMIQLIGIFALMQILDSQVFNENVGAWINKRFHRKKA